MKLLLIIISASDICVVSLPSTSIFDVDVPTKFYEYLACCRPQIGICGGDLAKLINSNCIGFTVSDGQIDKLAQVIVSLKNSPSLVISMEKNSHSILQKFTLDAIASKFKDILEEEFKKRKISVKNLVLSGLTVFYLRQFFFSTRLQYFCKT